MSNMERISHTVYGDFYSGAAAGKKDRYGTKTFDLAEIMDKVGRYVTVTTFMNEREVKGEIRKSIALIFNKSDAKYMPRDRSAQGDNAPASNPGIRRV